MPELPEVETIQRALRPYLLGRSFRRVEIFAEKLRTPLAPLLDPELLNRPVVDVRRRARYLIIELSGGDALLLHLGMSGVIRLEAPRARRKHEHIIIDLDDGMTFRFECTRRFSIVTPVQLKSPGAEPTELAGLGVEPLDETRFTAAGLHAMLENKHTPIKSALMDNAVVVGVGNIYATESLFAARLSPLHPAHTLSISQCETLVAEVRRILRAAIEAGGSSIRDYKHLDGTEGLFVQQMAVYGRKGLPCPRCGATLQSVRIAGRSSCYCPECQK